VSTLWLVLIIRCFYFIFMQPKLCFNYIFNGKTIFLTLNLYFLIIELDLDKVQITHDVKYLGGKHFVRKLRANTYTDTHSEPTVLPGRCRPTKWWQFQRP